MNRWSVIRKIVLLLLLFFMFALIGCISYEAINLPYGDTFLIGKGGTPPYTCELVEPDSIEPLSLKDCIISQTGDDPYNLTFKVKITDSTGKFTIVERRHTLIEPDLLFYVPDRLETVVGKEFSYSFCNGCGTGKAFNPIGGSPPYTFSISGQPSGFIMDSNGELTGYISEPGEFPVEVCVEDTKGDQMCKDSVIVIENCDSGESLVDRECCVDIDSNSVCDHEEVEEEIDEPEEEEEEDTVVHEVSCGQGESLVNGECCVDVNNNGVCDDDEPDYLFYDDFSNGYLEGNWQALYGTPEIDNSKGDPAPSLKLTDRTLLIGDTSPFNSKNGLEMSVMVNIDDFDDKYGFSITILDQVRGGAAASLQFNKGQQEGEIMFWYYMYPIDSVSKVLGTDVKTNDHQFHEYKFVIDPDGKAAWYRDGVQKKRLAGAARIPQGDMYFQFRAYNEPAYIDNVIIK